MAPANKISKIIIVGAGPSGLLLGILLSKAKIQVQLLDQASALDTNPRAAHYAPSSVRELRRAGVLEKVQAEGFRPAGVCWRTVDGEILGGIRADLSNEDSTVCLPLDLFDEILLREFEGQRCTEMLWNHNVVGVEQSEGKARVKVRTREGEKILGADYVVGCDGANSTVRKCSYGDEFPGITLESQIIATNVYYDFTQFNYWDSQFILDPKDWFMAARITRDGMWRVTYGDVPGLTTEEYLARLPMRYEQILPGKPKPGDYRLTNASPYKLHQRCVPKMRVGRILLAADAAHLCNPFGGMGLTGGIADITSLFDCLIALQNGLTDDSILDAYSEVRVQKWKEIINPSSLANFNRLWDENVADERKEFFERCKAMEEDEALRRRNMAVSILFRSSLASVVIY
ncbi:hypothetical protein HYALB_00001150 [Hymenoscyphus albidus]|uniref:FAD-binding domain-containing protein n=1 Tax=Hymenoscyphus albidus TaxID=595503 RepID=A0A9N9LH17_9HELO|nr:hypothetical protein HYALB_00001150 [Hymenoscyphus albidus]